MPQELVYLAAIESGFSPRAKSRVAASGMWQFMVPTARQYDLRIDEWVDERRDPVRATSAALDYLQDLQVRFGSWYLAAAAYNAGPGRVARALRLHRDDHAEEADIYWEILEHLPRDTQEYVPKMLALVLLSREAEGHGLNVSQAEPVRFEEVWVPGGTSVRRVAEILGLPMDRLVDLNPHLLRGVTPPGEAYALRVPPGRSVQVVASLGNRWRSVGADD
jgi:membrane-bound lytic murein transglycosylase D